MRDIAEELMFYPQHHHHLPITLEGLDTDYLSEHIKGKWQTKKFQKKVYVCLNEFTFLCRKHNLPFCNSIAFYNALLKDDAWKTIPENDLMTLLHRALGGEGFAFSSVFDWASSKTSITKRPVDFKEVNLKSIAKRRYRSAISAQAKLGGWYDYLQQQEYRLIEFFLPRAQDNYVFIDHCVRKSDDSKKYDNQSVHEKSPTYRFQLKPSMYAQILDDYTVYCCKQSGFESTTDPKGKESPSMKTPTELMDEIKDTMALLFELHDFYLELSVILQGESDALDKKTAGFLASRNI